jgi:hypothetical protein
MELYLHSQYAFMAWCLVKHKDNFTFIFTFLPCIDGIGSGNATIVVLQDDKAVSHFGLQVRPSLNAKLPGRWAGRSEPAK